MNNLASEYYYINPDSSLYYSLKVIQDGTNSSNARLSSINRVGLLELDKANYKDAITYFLKVLSICEKQNDTLKIAYSYNNIGVSYSALKDFNNAEKYLLLALKYFNYTKDNEGSIGVIYNNLSIIAETKDDFKNQFKYLKAAIYQYKSNGDSINLAVAQINLASYYNNKKDYKKALELTNEAMDIMIIKQSYPYLAKAYNALAEINTKLGNNQEALMNLSKCMDLCSANILPETEMECNKLYSDIYKNLYQYEKAYKHFNKYSNLKDSLMNETKQKQISELSIKYETVKKDKEISLLNKEQELQKEKLSTQKKILIALVVLVVLIVIFSIILFLLKRRQFLSYKDLVKKNIEIIEKEKQIDEVEINKSIIDKKQIPEIAKSNDFEINDDKYTHSNLSIEQKDELAAIVLLAMRKDKLFLDKELTITKLAKNIGINRTYLSQVINEFYNKNFSSFINDFRIKEATKILITDKNLTIEAIADSVGFKSKSAFNNAFKFYTGVTPSFFIKNASDNNR
jgi:YesN/AraC family two-component response regulator